MDKKASTNMSISNDPLKTINIIFETKHHGKEFEA